MSLYKLSRERYDQSTGDAGVINLLAEFLVPPIFPAYKYFRHSKVGRKEALQRVTHTSGGGTLRSKIADRQAGMNLFSALSLDTLVLLAIILVLLYR
jgi:hypothetical protein